MPESEVSLQGPVTSVDNPTLVILGVEIRTQPGTEFEAASGNDLMASTQFFAAVSPGTLVKVKGALQQRSVSRLAKSSWYNHRSARVSS